MCVAHTHEPNPVPTGLCAVNQAQDGPFGQLQPHLPPPSAQCRSGTGKGKPATEASNSTNINSGNIAAGGNAFGDSKAPCVTPIVDDRMQNPTEAGARFRIMLHGSSSTSAELGVKLGNISLKHRMQKRGKEVANPLKCHGLAISKTGIKVGRNKKKSSSLVDFSLLAALADFDNLNEELTEQDKNVLH